MSGTTKDLEQMGIEIPDWEQVNHFEKLGKVKVDLANGVEEEVIIDPERGALLLNWDGRHIVPEIHHHILGGRQSGGSDFKRTWKEMTYTEQKTMLHIVAKRNRKLKERFGWIQS